MTTSRGRRARTATAPKRTRVQLEAFPLPEQDNQAPTPAKAEGAATAPRPAINPTQADDDRETCADSSAVVVKALAAWLFNDHGPALRQATQTAAQLVCWLWCCCWWIATRTRSGLRLLSRSLPFETLAEPTADAEKRPEPGARNRTVAAMPTTP